MTKICSCGCGYPSHLCVKKVQRPVQDNELPKSERTNTNVDLETLLEIAKNYVKNPNLNNEIR